MYVDVILQQIFMVISIYANSVFGSSHLERKFIVPLLVAMS
jgi:hypothetical protein